MKLKDKLKNIDIVRKIVKKHKIKQEYLNDYKNFIKFYNDSFNETIQGIEYKILLLVHSLEKGMCHKKLRPFGEQKIIELITLMKKYSSFTEDHSTSFLMAIAIVKKWINIYDSNNYKKNDTYSIAKSYIKSLGQLSDNDIEVGAKEYKTNNNYIFDYNLFLETRHSVREFSEEPISKSDIDYCIKSALLSPTACNRQMVKIYSVKKHEKKEALNNVIMGLSGFEKKNINYFVITFDVCAFSFYGERNQGYFNSGLVSMNFVNALHSKNIGSCFLQWGNSTSEEKNIKSILGIPNNERISVIIAAGYYKEETKIPCSNRKKKEEIYNEI